MEAAFLLTQNQKPKQRSFFQDRVRRSDFGNFIGLRVKISKQNINWPMEASPVGHSTSKRLDQRHVEGLFATARIRRLSFGLIYPIRQRLG